MPTTAGGIYYPSPSDPFNEGALQIKATAESVDEALLGYRRSLAAGGDYVRATANIDFAGSDDVLMFTAPLIGPAGTKVHVTFSWYRMTLDAADSSATIKLRCGANSVSADAFAGAQLFPRGSSPFYVNGGSISGVATLEDTDTSRIVVSGFETSSSGGQIFGSSGTPITLVAVPL